MGLYTGRSLSFTVVSFNYYRYGHASTYQTLMGHLSFLLPLWTIWVLHWRQMVVWALSSAGE